MKKRAANVPLAAAMIARSVARAVGEAVAQDTPVDTGTARSNWIMSIDQIVNYVIPAYVPYIKTHSSIYEDRAASGVVHVMGTGDKEEMANLAAVLAQHFQALQSYDPERNTTIYITNNLPYIEKLDQGYSPQTEPGFVQRAVDEGVSVVRRMNLKLMGA